MKVNVLYFAQVAEKVGLSKEEISMPENGMLWDLMDHLVECYPILDELHFQTALNQTLTKENKALQDGDEVALLPPYAGG